jgi:sterol desaturase/sphingolipid hydroxylase (fatty acid hydroxylase superfamily)
VIYWHWLLGFSLFFVVAERLLPARPGQRPLRKQLGNDLFYLLFNGHFYAVLVGGLSGLIALRTRGLLSPVLPFAVDGSALSSMPFWGQFLLYLIVSDFLQWCVHNLLHRVPFLWQFHKLHHSIHEMDWAGNFRFHWMELIIYRSLLYVPLALLGGDGEPLLLAAIFSTFWGQLNHANVRLKLGPLGYLFNGPEMHLWHHDSSAEGGASKNYGIVLSIWDWLFGTAYWPRERAPDRIGYPGDHELPRDLPRQLIFPVLRGREQ